LLLLLLLPGKAKPIPSIVTKPPSPSFQFFL